MSSQHISSLYEQHSSQYHFSMVPTHLQEQNSPKILPDAIVGSIITMTFTWICKNFQLKNNKINNKSPIQIIQNNSLCVWPEAILQQQLLNWWYITWHYGAEPQPSPEGTERDGSHRASGFLPDERHGSAPTAALVTDQTTDHVQGEVLLDPAVSSRTASRPSGCQNTSIYYRSTLLPTICVPTVFASRAFYYSAPQVWNCLGTSTRSANTFSSFRRCLKSELFAAAYDT